MIHAKTSLALVLVLCLGAVSCSDDTSSPRDSSVTVDTGVDAKLSPDLGALPDIGKKVPCESEWRDAISPQKTASTGTVSTTTGTVNKTTVDASAGGMTGAHNNPFVYISLKDGSRVDVDDYAAKTSTAWDLALRRTVIRINGGDSGAGKGAVAILAGKTLDQVTAAPTTGFSTDEFLSSSCAIKRNAINNIWTAFGGSGGLWYDYSSGSHAVQPKKVVYVIRRAGGDHVKLVIDSFYNSANAGGHFSLSWSALK